MKIISRPLLLAFGIVSALVLSATVASATIWSLEANLDGLQETPPVATPGNGYATLSLNDVTGQLTLSGTFSSLIGTTTAAHIHGPAPIGTPAGVIVGITTTLGSTSGTLSGSPILSGANVANVLAGLTYINLHTTFRTGGEIRGQIVVVPEPTAVSLAGGALLMGACLRRKRAFRS